MLQHQREYHSLDNRPGQHFHAPMNAQVATPSSTAEGRRHQQITADRLGSREFRRRHNLRLAYVAGAMYKGIASKELVVRMGRSGLLGYLGTGGMTLDRIESELRYIETELSNGESWGLNLLSSPFEPGLEDALVDLYLRHDVRRVEAAAFTQVTPALVRYRFSRLRKESPEGSPSPRMVLAKVSRPEVARQFLSPAPEEILRRLVDTGMLRPEEASLAANLPMADDVCVEADSGGHTDRGVLHALLPVMLQLRDDHSKHYKFNAPICLGAAGGLGAPNAIAAAFVLGADFVLTGSINQCTVESGASDGMKDLLQTAEIQDTDIVPAGDMFEMGAKVQVLKKGLLFPARAKKLYDLYRQFESIEQIDQATLKQLETRYFKRSLKEVWNETAAYYRKVMPAVFERAERDPRHKMALIFRAYFVASNRWALGGDPGNRVDYQIHCGPALGAFNDWVRDTPLENWRNRHVDNIGDRLMAGAASFLQNRFHYFTSGVVDSPPRTQ